MMTKCLRNYTMQWKHWFTSANMVAGLWVLKKRPRIAPSLPAKAWSILCVISLPAKWRFLEDVYIASACGSFLSCTLGCALLKSIAKCRSAGMHSKHTLSTLRPTSVCQKITFYTHSTDEVCTLHSSVGDAPHSGSTISGKSNTSYSIQYISFNACVLYLCRHFKERVGQQVSRKEEMRWTMLVRKVQAARAATGAMSLAAMSARFSQVLWASLSQTWTVWLYFSI